MSRHLPTALAAWIEAGHDQIGEVAIRHHAGGFALTHYQETAGQNLEIFSDPLQARLLATYDDHGIFRPLKTAPNLRHGWKLLLADLSELQRALECFYPAMLGSLLSHESGEFHPIPLRETLARQSGMYAVTKKITDSQADAMIGEFCRSETGCLKTILWTIGPGHPVTSLPKEKFDPEAPQLATSGRCVPMLCGEACNLLVARAREIVKASTPPA